MLVSDPARIEADAQYEREYTIGRAARGFSSDLFKFVHLSYNEEVSMDTERPRAIAHSHTSIDTFETCPRQFQARYMTKEVRFVQTEASIYGDRMHKSMEARIKDGTALSDEFVNLEPVAQKVLALPGQLTSEENWAISPRGQVVGYFNPDVWLRGKADVSIWQPEKNYLRVFDWKTGKPKKDMMQLKIMALLGKAKYPEMTKCRVAFVYTKTGEIDTEDFTEEQLPDIVQEVRQKTKRIEIAVAEQAYPPTPNGLCKQWCQVTSCSFHGKGARG